MLRSVVERLQQSCILGTSTMLGMDEVPMQSVLRRIWWKPTLADCARAAREQSLRVGASELRLATELTFRSRSSLLGSGMIRGTDVTALLDCSGYAYGDMWSTRRVHARTRYYRQLRDQGAVLILLPQAMGPFEIPEVREAVYTLFGLFDLVFARDADSMEYLASLGVAEARVGLAPDITHLVEGSPPSDPDAWARRVCVVPNTRLLDRASTEASARYVDFVVRGIAAVRDAELEPRLVLHETNDGDLAREIVARLEEPVPIMDEDASVTKGVLGACHATIGSRFHGLVGALSQGTPSIGTSWSHKYQQLFSEYGCPEYCFSLDEDEAALDERVRSFLEPRRRAELHRQISETATRQKKKARRMWARVERVIRGGSAAPSREDSQVRESGPSRHRP